MNSHCYIVSGSLVTSNMSSVGAQVFVTSNCLKIDAPYTSFGAEPDFLCILYYHTRESFIANSQCDGAGISLSLAMSCCEWRCFNVPPQEVPAALTCPQVHSYVLGYNFLVLGSVGCT